MKESFHISSIDRFHGFYPPINYLFIHYQGWNEERVNVREGWCVIGNTIHQK